MEALKISGDSQIDAKAFNDVYLYGSYAFASVCV